MRIVAILAFMGVLFGADKAKFTKMDELVRPDDYREWIFLSSGLGMTYGPNAPAPGAPLRFDNVYANPSSYREFVKTGKWPDGTVLILEIRESESKGSINQHGRYQTAVSAIEAHVKDSRRISTNNGWAFYDIDPKGVRTTSKPLPVGNRCETCHSTNGAVDSTFVQFYPDLIPIALKHGTYKMTNSTTSARH
ncbi:MAG TPA: cytochrome P460 family protein [Bryobacteraceae bacterium]|nr:cytochrome P460 family protein [Bryobacteraceae bacterium]